MIISPPFLPADGLTSENPAISDPMMDFVDQYELGHHGVYPIAFDRRWHCGVHLAPSFQNEAVRAIADGDVVAYRVSQRPVSDGEKNSDGSDSLNSNTGFVLLRHTTETGEGRTITFYSLYMHLRDLDGIRNSVGPLPNNPPETGSSTVLPKWLSNSNEGVQVSKNLRVYRKDMLGYAGAHHAYPHLHFEIFMTEGDFTAWFEQSGHAVQLGNKNPITPASKDYWGHSYFVIPGGQTFVSTPPLATGAAAAYFPSLQSGTLDTGSKLYVEAYFHKGQRYTRSWFEKNGTLTPLTSAAVRDAYADYEYKMYERATALYPQCPSDGYELLRFGRILSDHPTLPAAAQKTWVAVTFETGKQGYIDISQPAIQKLSDADFPFFMGWQKVEEGNTPFSEDGICDYDELRKIVAVVEDDETPAERMRPAHEQEARLASYVANHAEVRERFRGFVCHAPSEWDASGNEARYKRLKDPDGFFGKRKELDPNGYDNFIKFLERFQFLEKTPLGSEKKFWFFHPLAFIRHFRKCRWLSHSEMAMMMPSRTYYTQSGALRTETERYLDLQTSCARLGGYRIALNKTIRKYCLESQLRLPLFFAQTIIETDRWKTVREYGSGRQNPNIPMAQYYAAFYGRGIMQLTWAENYESYGRYRGWLDYFGAYADNRITHTSLHYWADPTVRDLRHKIIAVTGAPKRWAPRYDPVIVESDVDAACDSGGYFWASKRHSGTVNISRVADKGNTPAIVDRINILVNGGGNGYYERQAYSVYVNLLCGDLILDGLNVDILTPRGNVKVRIELRRPI
ncbi:hypothetical protein BJN34_10505 [Cupriavidus necator]|uniref:Uncharacterized protein n=1 Tax=Cupriavidus necator TaxID=106590 RepID=A0A1U9UP13_CUPNE|nr:hypothetical protein [Cupriavidus necator]AQV94319.1 hypothetical protein BJN34_10505 [Cupriavidus necator]